MKVLNVEPDCHCLTTDWSKNEILPGNIAEIIVTYNTKSLGHFTGTITIDVNTKIKTYLLVLRGFIKEANEKEVEMPF